MTKRYKLLSGMQDFVGIECYNKSLITSKIERIFTQYGYDRIETPTMEYFNMFCEGFGAVDSASLFTFTDNDGKMVSLRTDMTIPVSRLVATKLPASPIPSRLFYTANSFSRKGSYLMTREYTQCGVELIGSSDILADVEIIKLAIQSMRAVGLVDFSLEIGHVGFFSGLLNQFGITSEQKVEICELVSRKDKLALELYLIEIGLDKDKKKAIERLPFLYGDISIIKQARSIATNDESNHALDELDKIYNILKLAGLADYITFDIGNGTAMSYYSGMVIKGYSDKCSSPLFSGGRYDDLCTAYDKKVSAVGFAIGIKNILIALDRAGQLESMPKKDYAIGYAVGCESRAIAYMDSLLAKGYSVINTFANKANLSKLKDSMIADNYVFIDKQEEVTL